MSELTGITGFPLSQEYILVTTERVASVMSLIGCFFVMFTFLWSSRFRKPVNRLIFYATWANLITNVGTLISIAGIRAGSDSPLCQFQGFLIQMFLPPDALWNLAMAINTYLTVFKRYNAAQCRAMEKWYLLVNLGVFGLIAFVYCFISNSNNSKVYGGAVLWCWIRLDWYKLRLITCYGPAWFCIVSCFIIYVASGRRLFQQEKEMAMRGESLSGPFIENPFTSFKTTEIQITSEAATPGNLGDHVSESQTELQNKTIERQYLGAHNAYEEYSVTIERRDVPFGRQGLQNMNEEEIRLRNTVAQANKVAKSYTLCCCLFFLSLLITWIPSTVFRIYTLYHTANSSFGMAYSTGLVLPLMGFWNAVIYTTISWDAVMDLFAGNLNRRKSRSWNGHLFRPSEWKRSDSKSKDSWVPRPRMLSLNSREGITEPGMPPTKVTKQNVGERSWTQ